jgi:L-asparaginase
MKNILVIFTGGTIGSKTQDKTINVDASSSYFLLDTYKNQQGRTDVTFETQQPLNILSEDLIPADWLELHSCLSAVDFTKYHGIIITHGTDTLPFTSAAISYLFNNTPIPIVLTASNYPLGYEKSNGLRNFANSVDFIMDQDLPGIFVVFEDRKGESIVHLGTRLTQALPFTDEFDSMYSEPFGKMMNGSFQRNDHKLNPTFEALKSERNGMKFDKVAFSSDVVYIKPHPGLSYQYFDFDKHKPKAVLHDLYHSGTACTREMGNQYSIEKFIEYSLDKGVDFFISPIKNLSGDLYSSSQKMFKNGAVPLENITIEASIVKLMLAYGVYNHKEEIMDFLNQEPLFFEFNSELYR